MATASRRSVWALVIGVLVASQALFVSLPASTRSDTSCTVLRAWAQSYAHRSVTLDHLATFDRAHRLAIFDAVTPTVRAGLWQEQFRRLARQTEWSSAQRTAIAETATYLTPAFYDQTPAVRSPFMRQQWARIAALFPLPAQRRGFFQLGSVVAPEPAPVASLYEQLARPFRVQAMAQTTWCECSATYGNVECYPGLCLSASCTPKSGCGFSGTETCVGMCSY
jgi:hypothetical protein